MNITKSLALSLTMTGFFVFFYLGEAWSYERLGASALASIAGLDDEKDPYDTNCAYTSLEEGEVAWRDCNGQPDDTPCVECISGDYESFQGGVADENVRESQTQDFRCDFAVRSIGSCESNMCTGQTTTPDACSGTPIIYEPQPTDGDPPTP